VAGNVVLALALKAGFPPLAADRASRAAAEAVRSAGQPLELAAWAADGQVGLEVAGRGGDWQTRAAGSLEPHDPLVVDGKVSVVLRAPPRGAIAEV
jgi:hypothetical protein